MDCMLSFVLYITWFLLVSGCQCKKSIFLQLCLESVLNNADGVVLKMMYFIFVWDEFMFQCPTSSQNCWWKNKRAEWWMWVESHRCNAENKGKRGDSRAHLVCQKQDQISHWKTAPASLYSVFQMSVLEWGLLQWIGIPTIIRQHFSDHANTVQTVCLCDFTTLAFLTLSLKAPGKCCTCLMYCD